MQFNRLHKILSARACEYLFVLRSCFNLIKNDLITLAFPKKNPFSEVDNQVTNAVNLAGGATKQELAHKMSVLGEEISMSISQKNSNLA